MSNSDKNMGTVRTKPDFPAGIRGRSKQVVPDIRVGFMLAPLFTLLPFASFIDTLRHAADEADRSRQRFAHWSILGATEDAVVSSCGIEVCPWELFGDPKEFDYVVVVGGLVYGHEKQHLKGLEFLYRAHEQGVGLVGLCTGSFLIAEMGLLDGRRCAVHFRHQEEFKALYPKVNVVTDELFVEDNGIFTCPGGTAAVDVAVELIAREAGPARAMKALPDLVVVQRRMGVQPPPKSNDVPLYCDDERVEQAIKTMQSHLSKPKTTSDLAEMVGLGVAQFNRIFFQHVDRVPQEYYRLLRLKHARWRLLNSRRSVAEIAKECGFSDSAHMGRWFKREFGTPPGQFRKAARPGNGNGRHR